MTNICAAPAAPTPPNGLPILYQSNAPRVRIGLAPRGRLRTTLLDHHHLLLATGGSPGDGNVDR